MTPEAKQAIIELLAQVARQNGAIRVEVRSFGGRVSVRARTGAGGELAASAEESGSCCRWAFDCLSCAGDPAYARALDLWSQIVAAAKAMERRD